MTLYFKLTGRGKASFSVWEISTDLIYPTGMLWILLEINKSKIN
jgi:hypothetical protein